MVLHLLSIEVSWAKITAPWEKRKQYRNHYAYAEEDRKHTNPVISLVSSSSSSSSSSEAAETSAPPDSESSESEREAPAKASASVASAAEAASASAAKTKHANIPMIGGGPGPRSRALPWQTHTPKQGNASSEKHQMQLAKVWVMVEVNGQPRRVLALLDTQSNATFLSTRIAQTRPWDKGETNKVSGLGGEEIVTDAAQAVLIRNDKRVLLKGRMEPGGKFDDSHVHLLLSCTACRELGIDVNYAVDNLRHEAVRYRDGPTAVTSTQASATKAKRSRPATTTQEFQPEAR